MFKGILQSLYGIRKYQRKIRSFLYARIQTYSSRSNLLKIFDTTYLVYIYQASFHSQHLAS